jgi:hypothetical protein
MYKLSQNRFVKGLNQDIDPRMQNPDTYRKAVNMALTGDGDFYSLRNINGSTVFDSLTFNTELGNVNILGAYEVNGLYEGVYGSDENNSSLIIFAHNSSGDEESSAIFLYDTVRFELYKLLEDEGLNFKRTSTIDAVIEGEGNIDNIYFVDNVNPPRDMKVKYNPSEPLSSHRELTSIPYAPLDELKFRQVTNGGSLDSGTYQIAYRYYNSKSKKYSTFSLFTNPIPVYPTDLYEKEFVDEVYGGVPNESTNKSIQVTIARGIFEDSGLYDSVQLAVLKNTDGSKIPSTLAYLTSPSKDWYNSPGSISYEGGFSEESIDVTEIVVDDAPIETAKTIEIKEGVLFLGNIKYRDLSIGDEEGVVSEGGEVVTKDIGLSGDVYKPGSSRAKVKQINQTGESAASTEFGYKNPNNCVRAKGYFRDEVYRFGVTYMDEFGAWSPPKTFDFSDKTAFTLKGSGYDVGSFIVNAPRGTTSVYITTATELDITEGDYIYLSGRGGTTTDEYYTVMTNKGIVGGSHLVEVAGIVEWSSYGRATETLGSEYTHVKEGGDFKFPSREKLPYTIISESESSKANGYGAGEINAMGLNIKGLTSHPSWAKAYAIVRVARERDILYQSPQIPVVASNATLNDESGGEDPCTIPEGANSIGSYGAMSISKGGAFGFLRGTNRDLGVYQPISPYRMDAGEKISAEPINLTLVIPPEYMMSSVDGEAFRNDLLNIGANINIVDAVSFIRTQNMDIDGSGIDSGINSADQGAFALRGDTRNNYYYQEKNNPESSEYNQGYINAIDNLEKFFSANGKSKTKSFTPLSNNGSGTSLPEIITPNRSRSLLITDIGDFNGVSLQNFGQIVKLQKALAIITEDKFGDITYIAAKKGEGGTATGTTYRYDNLQFGRDQDVVNKEQYNIDSSSYDTTVNTIVDHDSASFAAAIVNVTRGLQDDRYGDVNRVHNFFFTGSYGEIDSTDQVIDKEVFGGDCFISKANIKVNDSVLMQDAGDIPCNQGNTNNLYARAYKDWQEVISCYLETEVNCDLQADAFGYPVTDKNSVGEFRQDFNYPYHFGYSIDNIIKAFINEDEDIGGSREVKYPARIAYSDRHVPNSNDGSYGRFRTLAFYDLSETYGAITKLIKLSNENVYSLQESGVSVIPIGRNVIEDSTGGQLVVNSDTLINTPQYLYTNNGCQHIRSVVNATKGMFFIDARTAEVFRVGEGEDGKVSDLGMFSYFEEKLESNGGIPEWVLSGAYDFAREEYIIHSEGFTETDYINQAPKVRLPFSVVWSQKINGWISEMDIGGYNLKRYVTFKNGLVALGDDGTSFNIEGMYLGNEKGKVLGSIHDSSMSLILNPEGTFAKTFDNLRVDSSNRLTEMEVKVYNEVEQADKGTGRFTLNVSPRQGGYEVPTIRDEVSNGRMRGKYCECIFYIDNSEGSRDVKINNVTLKYRMSENRFRNSR